MATSTQTSAANYQTVSLLAFLRERPGAQVVLAYGGGAWLAYEVADLLAFIFGIPDVALRAFVLLLVAGGVLAALLGRWMKLTVTAVRRGLRESEEDIRGVPDALEPLLMRLTDSVSGRTTLLALTGAAVFFCLCFLLLFHSWAEAHERQVPDSRITVAVFPFGEAVTASGGLGPGLADLLSATLDGTPGLRVVDPSSLWRTLPSDRDGAPVAPAPDEAREVSRNAGVTRFVTGNLIGLGSRVEISAAVHHVEPEGTAAVPVRISAHQDSLGAAVERLAADVIATVWQRDQLPTVPNLDRSVTGSAEALKAYLEAMGALRQGRLEAAREAAERAVGLDSTFALAHLARLSVETDLLFSQGMPFTGLRPIIDAAARHGDRLTPRSRMRIDAYRALDATDGSAAAFLFERILAIDSLDVDALGGLASTYLFYGWQLDADPDEVSNAYRRLVRADPYDTGARATMARLALWNDDVQEAAPWVDGLARQDSLGAYARGAIGSYEILVAPGAATDSLLAAWAGEEVGVVTTVLRDLRMARPDLAQLFVDELSADSMPSYHRRIGEGSRAQLWMARGRLAGVDSLLETGQLDGLRSQLSVYQVAAALAGVGDPERASLAAVALANATPLDSLDARPAPENVWMTGWAVGAYHAALGDTAEARRWEDALGALPPGETNVPEWPSSLAADIQARLAVRRGDLAAAETWARRAYTLWVIHGWNVLESHPEPAIRFHLAEVLRARGLNDRAESLYRSLGPPHTWMGSYTARAAYALGELLESQGRMGDAAGAYEKALRLWEGGDVSVVGQWLERAREGLQRTAP